MAHLIPAAFERLFANGEAFRGNSDRKGIWEDHD